MDVQPLQMVIALEIPPEFWDLTIAPGCWLWVPLVLREHHAHLVDEGLRTTQAQGREFFPFPVGETEYARTFRHGESVSRDLTYQRYLLCYFRHLMYCTCPNPWGKVGILIHNASEGGIGSSTVGEDFGGTFRNFILKEYEYYDDALMRPEMDLSYDPLGGYVQNTSECLARLAMTVPNYRMGPEVRLHHVPGAVDTLMPEYYRTIVPDVAALDIAEPLDVDRESSAGSPPSLVDGTSDGSYDNHEPVIFLGYTWVPVEEQQYWGPADNVNPESQ